MPVPERLVLPLAGESAIVTGGRSGIGLACAAALVRDGASVTICGRHEDRLRAASAELEAVAGDGASIGWVACDVADEQSVAGAVAQAVERAEGSLDLAVASAGTGAMGPVIALTLQEWDRLMTTNLTGAFLLFKHVGGAMARTGGGAMAAISSIATPLTHRYMAPYSVSKAGLDVLVKVTADELGRAGVRVNSVRPGVVSTELGDHLLGDPTVVADHLAQMPLARIGTVEDVAAAVRFLLGPESSWITGQCLGVDGGHALRRGPDLEHWARAAYGDAAVNGG